MSLLEAINIGSSGLLAQGQRLQVHAKNIANVDTPNYVRKVPTLYSADEASFHGVLNNMKNSVLRSGSIPHNNGGVIFGGVVEDPTVSDLIYKPGHPDADKNGYIRASNVNPVVDMADATMSARAYEASLAVIGITKQMAQRATDIGR